MKMNQNPFSKEFFKEMETLHRIANRQKQFTDKLKLLYRIIIRKEDVDNDIGLRYSYDEKISKDVKPSVKESLDKTIHFFIENGKKDTFSAEAARGPFAWITMRSYQLDLMVGKEYFSIYACGPFDTETINGVLIHHAKLKKESPRPQNIFYIDDLQFRTENDPNVIEDEDFLVSRNGFVQKYSCYSPDESGQINHDFVNINFNRTGSKNYVLRNISCDITHNEVN